MTYLSLEAMEDATGQSERLIRMGDLIVSWDGSYEYYNGEWNPITRDQAIELRREIEAAILHVRDHGDTDSKMTALAAAVLRTAPTESVSTHDLKEGDLIRFYGVVLELRDRKEHGVTAPHTEAYHGQVITFRTNVIDDSQNHGFIPPSWLKEWVVQGNQLATWARIVRF